MKKDKYNLLFSVAVWGREYVKNFLLYSLASQLSCNNLPYLYKNNCIINYYVYTREEDKVIFQKSPEFKKLKSIANIKFIWLDKELKDETNKYSFMVFAHRDTIIHKSKIGDYMFFMVADAIYSDSFFKYIYKQLTNNKKVIYVFAFRTNPELKYYCRKNFYNFEENSISVDSNILTKLAIRNMHIDSKSHIISNKGFTNWPSYIIEKISDGMLIRCFHLHPFVIQANSFIKNISLEMETIDGSNLNLLDYFDKNEIGYISNSKSASIFSFELSKKPTEIYIKNREFNFIDLAGWIKKFAGKDHIKLVEKDFVFNLNEKDTKNSKLGYYISMAKKLSEADIIFEDFEKIQYEFLQGNYNAYKKMVLKIIEKLKKCLEIIGVSKEDKNKYLMKINKIINSLNTLDKDFLKIIKNLDDILNKLGGGKSFFTIYDKNETIKQKIKQMPEKVVLYGLGNFGKEVFFLLKYFNKKIEFIIDDNLSINNFQGIKIKKFNDFKNPLILNNYYLLFTIKNPKFVKKVKEKLKSLGIKINEI